MPLCVNTVFSRIFHNSVHFYRVLPCKTRVSRICKNIRVLPCKSHFWAQKGPQNGSQNGPRIAQNTCFTGVLSRRPSSNTVFYHVKWTSNRPKWRMKLTYHFIRVLPCKMRTYLDMNGKRVRILENTSKFRNILMILSIGYTCKNVLIILRIASTACM